jgi:hypothetical protein
MSPSEEIKLTKFLKEVLNAKIDNSEKLTSQILDASVSVFKNTLIWVLSMIHSPVFSVWTSTSSLKDPEAGLVLEEDVNQELELNTESPKMKLWNGSEENMMVPSTTDSITTRSLHRHTYLNFHFIYFFQNYRL